jgi:hypothetical protein
MGLFLCLWILILLLKKARSLFLLLLAWVNKMETVQLDPAQINQLLAAVNSLVPLLETGFNVVASGLACVCFWLGMNSWESVAK